MYKYDIKSHNYTPWHNEDDLSQTITKHMVEAAYTCGTPHWRADVKIFFGNSLEYHYNFSSEGKVTEENMNEISMQDRLHVEFYEVFLGEIGLPDVKRHTAEITFYALEDNTDRNLAVEEQLYRTLAEYFIRAIRLFPKRLFAGRCIKSGKEFVY